MIFVIEKGGNFFFKRIIYFLFLDDGDGIFNLLEGIFYLFL